MSSHATCQKPCIYIVCAPGLPTLCQCHALLFRYIQIQSPIRSRCYFPFLQHGFINLSVQPSLEGSLLLSDKTIYKAEEIKEIILGILAFFVKFSLVLHAPLIDYD